MPFAGRLRGCLEASALALLPSFRLSISATRTAAKRMVFAFLVAASSLFLFSRATSAPVRRALGRSTAPGVNVVRLRSERFMEEQFGVGGDGQQARNMAGGTSTLYLL